MGAVGRRGSGSGEPTDVIAGGASLVRRLPALLGALKGVAPAAGGASSGGGLASGTAVLPLMVLSMALGAKRSTGK